MRCGSIARNLIVKFIRFIRSEIKFCDRRFKIKLMIVRVGVTNITQ